MRNWGKLNYRYRFLTVTLDVECNVMNPKIYFFEPQLGHMHFRICIIKKQQLIITPCPFLIINYNLHHYDIYGVLPATKCKVFRLYLLLKSLHLTCQCKHL